MTDFTITAATDAVAAKAGLSKTAARAAIDALLESVGGALENGSAVSLAGFGKFQVKERAARKGRNPRTGEEVTINASKSIGFTASKTLKDRLK